MKSLLVFAAMVAVSAAASAQFRGFQTNPTPFVNLRGRSQGAYQGQYQGQYQAASAPVASARAYASTGPAVVARASSSDQSAQIVRYENEISPDGSFNYLVETDNGISAQAQGTPREFPGNPPQTPVVIQGSYSYQTPEGVPVAITYIADENGYQPQGEALPTPPPIPPQILRSLEYLAKYAPAQQ